MLVDVRLKQTMFGRLPDPASGDKKMILFVKDEIEKLKYPNGNAVQLLESYYDEI